MASDGGSRSEGGQLLKQLVQNLRSDLNLLSNEARKKYPAVREVRRTVRHITGLAGDRDPRGTRH